MGMFPLASLLGPIIRKGTLIVSSPSGAYTFGSGAPLVTVEIADRTLFRRLLLEPDLAVGEAYVQGSLTVKEGDIYDFLELCLANLGWRYGHWFWQMQADLRRFARRFAHGNPASRARANVAHHYDLSDTLYELFLDADRQYSCAYYRSQNDTLEQAQEHKKDHIAAKLLLQPGQRVLDIGCGWGGLALHLARIPGVEVKGITLSAEQCAYAQGRARELGLADRAQFQLEDYRNETGRYERIVSVGMFEHVGVRDYREYFGRIRDLLTEEGVALVHTIGSATGPGYDNRWLLKYIFPGGHIPALSEIVPAIERVGLYIADIEVLRLHYAETLKAWRKRFVSNRERIAALYSEQFCRMWEFYLASCEAGFRHSGLVNFQIQLSKRVDAVPITRDYLYDWRRWDDVSRRVSTR
jgi:cyclopropane-fatty-acyl-phospholipid synthase